MSLFNSGKKEPQTVAAPEPHVPMPMPQRRQAVQQRISEEAARAAQHVIDVEDENEQLRQQYAIALNRIALLEQHIQDYKRVAMELAQERDDYKHYYSHIATSLQNARSILDRVADVPPRADNGENNERVKQAVRGLEEALTSESPKGDGEKTANP